MKNQWSQFPFVLRRKILLTFLAGIASIAVSLVIFTVAADRILLVLGGLIFAVDCKSEGNILGVKNGL